LDAATIYDDHARFVWLTLQRLGVRAPDLEDVLQEVFVVVHQQLPSFEGRSKQTTWLFGICLRVVAAHRRRAYRRRERVTEGAGAELVNPDDPETLTAARQAREKLDALLDALDLEKRAVFVMFEVEGLSTRQIADLLELPLGTVYSRLHTARAELQKALRRAHARELRP
jgi:RNA polymerase sigma-70 factor (ECF subfamily)